MPSLQPSRQRCDLLTCPRRRSGRSQTCPRSESRVAAHSLRRTISPFRSTAMRSASSPVPRSGHPRWPLADQGQPARLAVEDDLHAPRVSAVAPQPGRRQAFDPPKRRLYHAMVERRHHRAGEVDLAIGRHQHWHGLHARISAVDRTEDNIPPRAHTRRPSIQWRGPGSPAQTRPPASCVAGPDAHPTPVGIVLHLRTHHRWLLGIPWRLPRERFTSGNALDYEERQEMRPYGEASAKSCASPTISAAPGRRSEIVFLFSSPIPLREGPCRNGNDRDSGKTRYDSASRKTAFTGNRST